MSAFGTPTRVSAAASGFALVALGLGLTAGAYGQEPAERTVPYSRSLYTHWTDDDNDCQDTRQEVLIAESTQPVELDNSGCRVVAGRWFDPYTAQTVTNPSELDIDHLIPLAEAHRSGANAWDAERRRKFANDLFHVDALIAVTASANRSKGARDPARWLPPNHEYRCEYARAWVVHKATWGLALDKQERLALMQILQGCGAGNPGPAPTGHDNVSEAAELAEPAIPGRDGECTDANSADGAAFETVSGIGPSKARAIIEYRERNGPFASLDDIESVRGIGPVTLGNIRRAGFCVP